jgi:hypothetical protein
MRETGGGDDVLAEYEPFLAFVLSCDLRRRERDARLLGVAAWLLVPLGSFLVVTSSPDRAKMMVFFLLVAPAFLFCHIGARVVRYQIRLFRIIRALHRGRPAAGSAEAQADR